MKSLKHRLATLLGSGATFSIHLVLTNGASADKRR
jgi:hypothetical protein